MKNIIRWRRACQLIIFFLFAAIPVLNFYGFTQIRGNFLAFHFFGIPIIDPLSALQVFVATFSVTDDMIIGAGISLALAFFLGPVFCSWVCPYGLLSELLHKTTKRFFLDDKEKKYANVDIKNTLPKENRTGIAFKISIVTFCLFFIFLYSMPPILNQLSLPAWYSRIWQIYVLSSQILVGATVFIIALLLIEMACKTRLWCTYLCPQSLLLKLFGGMFSRRLKISFSPKSCICPSNKKHCRDACSLKLDPRKVRGLNRILCNNCGDCVDACENIHCKTEQNKKERALSFTFEK